MTVNRRVFALAALGLVVSLAGAHANYTGYSGAPGSVGTCASSCHGSGTGTIVVSGFPAAYVPGQAYVVTVKHNGGSRIQNFNGSVRAVAGGQTAGVIAAGVNTTTYSVTQEPNGIHLTSASKDSGTFTWTAPTAGTGSVKLYVAGIQSSMNGPNTAIALTSAEGASVEEEPVTPEAELSLDVENPLVSGYLILRLSVPGRMPASLKVMEYSGRVVAAFAVSGAAPGQAVCWSPVDRKGRRLRPGQYFVTLSAAGRSLTNRFTIVE